MSFSALLTATQTVLTTNGNVINPRQIQIRLGPRPAAFSGMNRYITIHPQSITPGPSIDHNNALDEYYSIAITISLRASTFPDDQLMQRGILADVSGLETLARRVQALMYRHRFDIIKEANDLLTHPINRVALEKEYDPNNLPSSFTEYTNNISQAYSPYDNPAYLASSEYVPPQFIEPLRFTDSSPISEAPDWYPAPSNSQAINAIFLTLFFSEARRMQSNFTSIGVF